MSCRIAFIGGTGPEGLGLAMRFAKAGHMVYIGSRTEERAQEAIEKIKEKVPEGDVFGGLNAEGAEKADFVFVTVPWEAHAETLADLAEEDGSFHAEPAGVFHHGFAPATLKKLFTDAGLGEVEVAKASVVVREKKKYPVLLATGRKK